MRKSRSNELIDVRSPSTMDRESVPIGRRGSLESSGRGHAGQNSILRAGHHHGKLSPTPTLTPVAMSASNDRLNMLLMEANEISQYLKKDYVRSISLPSLICSSSSSSSSSADGGQ